MKKLNIELLKKLENKVDKQGREVCKYRDCGRCNKEVFVNRFLNKLLRDNYTYKLQINGVIYYALFPTYTITNLDNGKIKYKSCGVSYRLGNKHFELSLDFIDEKGKLNKITLTYNNLLDLKFKTISFKKYIKVFRLFEIKE